ncbi:hypothetical protein Tco_0167382, partial [Tanacetum coccineum]
MNNSSNHEADVEKIFVEEDKDLMIIDEKTVMKWLHALDMQLVGACRTGESLKPMFKLNVSCGVAEDRLLSHLTSKLRGSIGLIGRIDDDELDDMTHTSSEASQVSSK